MQSIENNKQIEKLKKSISKKSIISQSLLTAIFLGLAFALKGIWLDGLNLRSSIFEGISWSSMAIITVPSLINYFGQAKISELEEGRFDWKDYYQPIRPLLIVMVCIAIALPLKVAIASCCK